MRRPRGVQPSRSEPAHRRRTRERPTRRRRCTIAPGMLYLATMSDERTRDRGSLFENADKKKPSQPDLQGECRIGGVDYEVRAWRREEQLTIAVAPRRG